MDYEGINDDTMESFTSDSVQWQGSQTPCAALDSLLSEAAFKPQTEFPGSTTFAGGNRGSSRASTSKPLPSRSFATASNLNRPRLSTSTSSWQVTSTNPGAVPSWQAPPSDHRSRQPRASASSTGPTLPVGDPEQFMNMLKGISERIDGNIRTDASVSGERVKRSVPSKRITSGSVVGGKRIKSRVPIGVSARSISESSAKGKGWDSGALSCASTNTLPFIGGCDGLSKSPSAQLNSVVMDVDPPKSSMEIMPPPPIPPFKAKPSPLVPSATRQGTSRLHPHQPSTTFPLDNMHPDTTSSKPSLPTLLHSKPAPLPRDHPSTPAFSPAPASTPKLHPLLDPERKRRRLKLERTISASLSSSPSEVPSTSNPSSHVISPPVPPVYQRAQAIRPQSNQQNTGSSQLSQGRPLGNSPRVLTLGMRRTHTFPSTGHRPSTSTTEDRTSLPAKQKPFRPPLLSNSQPPLTPSTTSSLRSNAPSSERSFTLSKTSPPTSTDTLYSKSGDEDMEDLPPSSDADLSFGDAVSFDMDMDALEEAMRKYD